MLLLNIQFATLHPSDHDISKVTYFGLHSSVQSLVYLSSKAHRCMRLWLIFCDCSRLGCTVSPYVMLRLIMLSESSCQDIERTVFTISWFLPPEQEDLMWH